MEADQKHEPWFKAIQRRATEAERRRCAKIADDFAEGTNADIAIANVIADIAHAIANAIRKSE